MKFDVQWIYNTYTIVVTGIIDYIHTEPEGAAPRARAWL